MSFSDDEDIRRAIALSLQESSPQPKPEAPVIDLISSDEDADLDGPIHTKYSKTMNQSTQKKGGSVRVIPLAIKEGEIQEKSHLLSEANMQLVPDSSSKPQSAPVSSVMLGLNRTQMEAERLERVKQRKQRDEELLSRANGSNDSNDLRKRKVSVSENRDGRQVKAKYSNPWELAAEHVVSSPAAC